MRALKEIKRRDQKKSTKGDIHKKSSKGEQQPKKQNKLRSKIAIL